MAYQRTQAQKLLTVAELALFDAGRTSEIGKLSKPELRSKLERSRKLRDKYRDLYRRQRLAIRNASGSKAGTGGNANRRTQEKEEIFAESVARFEARLAKIEKQEDREFEKAQKAASSKVPAAKMLKKAVAKKLVAAKQSGTAASTRAAKASKGKVGEAKAQKKNVSKSARAVESTQLTQQSRGLAIGAHQRSQAKRSQAKRDSR
ncbi:hypothetical protein [Oxalicibacterium faecigallinarum]|uniref:Uncharacterized protein n=1 Tax=Oxalicibacterium faecigallinarum TaxID=573741 RepID=A0A8J3F4H5_9BURK|nr:hypothetical protein [Oxalicibacterium faecigallinarum]GGI21177.1 hypothetical protein GCM10008066_27760 [Oxalicibacterium faecigallinarum]